MFLLRTCRNFVQGEDLVLIFNSLSAAEFFILKRLKKQKYSGPRKYENLFFGITGFVF